MNIIISTHNVTLTEAIESHLFSRLEKLSKLDRFAIGSRVILEHDVTKAPKKQFSCSIRLEVPGPDLFAEHTDSDLYTSIDIVTKKVEQQIRKRHNKYKALNHSVASKGKRTRQEREA